MARSIWKGPYIDKTIWKRLKKIANLSNQSQEESKTNMINMKPWGKIFNRRSMITPEFIGTKCEVYTGNKWINLSINEDRIGHLFGEFAPTKKIAQFKRKAKAKKKK